MPTNILVNIDTVDFSAQGMQFHIPEATTAQVTNDDGVVLDRYQNRKAVDGKHGVHPVQVRTLHDGKELQIQGSPYAFLYGQNVYTGCDLSHACFATLEQVCKTFDIQPDAALRSSWKEGHLDLKKVDLAVNFRLESEQEVKGVLRQIARQLLEQGRAVSVIDHTVYWMPKSGKIFSMVFYAKGPHLRRSKRIKKLDDYEKLLSDAATILRVELRLRADALRSLGLEKVSSWQQDTALNIFKQYMKKLQFLSITSGVLKKEELDALSGPLRPVLALHKAGQDLEGIYGPRTLQRHRRTFRERGIDLRCPNQADAIVVSLPRMLSPQKAIVKPPRWLCRRGYCPSMDNPVTSTEKLSLPAKVRPKLVNGTKHARRFR